MQLKGKRIERLNKYGNDLAITLGNEGQMRLSPALITTLGITPDDNRVGFGYPEAEGESLVIYKSIDDDGVAVNKHGYLKNIPHNRDIRINLNLELEGKETVSVNHDSLILDGYQGYTFFEISVTTTEEVENNSIEEELETIEDVIIEDVMCDPESTPIEKTVETEIPTSNTESTSDADSVWF